MVEREQPQDKIGEKLKSYRSIPGELAELVRQALESGSFDRAQNVEVRKMERCRGG